MSRKKPDTPDVLPVDPNDVPFAHPLKEVTFASHPREVLEIIYKDLSAPFPEEAIQRTKKAETRKGYDTTGIGYQYVANRLNEVLSPWGWGWEYRLLNHDKGEYRSGQAFHDITAEVTVYLHLPIVDDPKSLCLAKRICVGSHISTTYGDALKGAITNGFKKTAALFGVGKGAYEGTLDDDAAWPEGEREGRADKPKPEPAKESPKEGHKNGEHQHPQVKAIHALYDRLKIPKEERHGHAEKILKVPVNSFNDLSYEARGEVISVLNGLVGGK